MTQFQREVLERVTPCSFSDGRAIVRGVAESHVELVLIHPFREGNGRLDRVLSTLMALQAGLSFLNFRTMAGEGKRVYITAIQAGLDKDYASMEQLLERIIEESDRSS